MLDRYTQNMLMSSAKFAEERNYWFGKLQGELVMSGFPLDRLRRTDGPYRPESLSIRLDGAVHENLMRLSNGSPLGVYMGALLGIGYLLYRYTGSEDLLLGMPAFRTNGDAGAGEAAFHFPLRLPIRREESGKELLLRIKEAVGEARKHRNIPFELLAEQVDIANRELLPLFCTVVAMKQLHGDAAGAGIEADAVFLFDLASDALDLTITYNAELYDRATIEQVAAHFSRLLGLAVGDLNRPLAEWDILSEEERRRIVSDFNDTADPYPSDKSLHEMFRAQALATPDNLAIISEEGNLTYRELEEKSNQCAHYLLEKGVQSQELVGVIAKRTPHTLVNIFGILKAGGVYVPVDPDHPEERRNLILQNSNCRLLLQPDAYEQEGMHALPTAAPELSCDSGRLAYVLYTSGSTGIPKGVAITHRNALNTVLACNRKFSVTEADRMIGISSFCFDLSVFDIFGTLSAGAALVLVPNQRDIPKIVELADKHGVTVWNSVPAILNLACDLQAGTEKSPNETLRLIMLSGDWIPLELFGKATSRYVNAQFVSLGGPTETSIWSIHYPVPGIDPEWVSIPYGMPMPNQQLYILNQDLQPCPFGVEGELYIGGDGVGAGYFNDEKRTSEFFIEHPEFGRLYKSGDFGLLKREGYIKLNGRKDFQIKIRGFRIDTKEIQATLLKVPGVTAAAVVARGEQAESKYLCAYYVADGEGDVRAPEIRRFLAARLPDYMVPSYFVPLAQMPLSANSKVDLNQLPEPDKSHLETGAAYEAPRNETEAQLVRVFQEVLGVEPVGIHDNFFALGGTSINALQAVTKLSAAFAVEMGDLFERQTAAHLAEWLQSENEREEKHPALLHLQAGEESRSPLYLVHPVSGIAFCYADFAKGLDAQQPLYGLQAQGLQEGEEPFGSLEEMAAHYVSGIRTVQPEGPYLLGGWSLGGVVAFEMARQLQEQGESVTGLVMIDSFVPAQSELPDDDAMVRGFAYDLAGRFGVDMERDKAFEGMEHEAMLSYVLEQAHLLDILPKSFGLSDLKRYFAVFRANVEAYRRYEPAGSVPRVLLYRAVDEPRAFRDETHGWNLFAETVEALDFEGDHYTIVQEPQVSRLTEHLNGKLPEWNAAASVSK